jgi:hypothetical protein
MSGFFSKNECDCPEPPGGVHRCPADQLAICKIVDGRIETDCLGPPRSALEDKETLTQWLVNALIGEVPFFDPTFLERAIRYEGRGEVIDVRGNRVSFRLSKAMMNTLTRDDYGHGPSDDDRRGSPSPAMG